MEKTNGCSFCELLNDVKGRFDYDATKDCVGNEEISTFKCKATLVVEDYRKAEFGCKISYNPRKLNFCPECGRVINKTEIYW